MNKKVLIRVLGFMLFFIAFACCSYIQNVNKFPSENKNTNNETKLYVYGKLVQTSYEVDILHEKTSAHIPFLTVCEAMGAKCVWFGKTNILINFDTDFYILNLKKQTLFEIGNNFNIISYPPGGKEEVRYCVVNKNEIILDNISLSHFMYLRNTIIEINYETSTININKKTIREQICKVQ